ncbi:MAG TPA: hypothetical protein VKA44_01930 [Gemmatimonadota bacterium]|nr:hypothetical protein [Gemmatimonadota bacterium]
MDLLLALALLFLLLALGFLWAGVRAFRGRSVAGGLAGVVVTLLFLALSALCAAVSTGMQGYRALTREEVAAVVDVRPAGPQLFRAAFRFPDGTRHTYMVAGDQIYVDAKILKWKPLVNVLGLHTAYELDRVGGRYRSLEDERSRPRTVYSLGRDHAVDLFGLRKRLPFLAPIVDAAYGSGTFVPVSDTATLEVRVSTSGLLIRTAEPGEGGAPGRGE